MIDQLSVSRAPWIFRLNSELPIELYDRLPTVENIIRSSISRMECLKLSSFKRGHKAHEVLCLRNLRDIYLDSRRNLPTSNNVQTIIVTYTG
jgi:hypothetical protein